MSAAARSAAALSLETAASPVAVGTSRGARSADCGNRREPWTRRDVVVCAGLTLLGTALVGVASYGSAGGLTLDETVRWLNLGVAGVVTAAIGGGHWYRAGRRAVSSRWKTVGLEQLGPSPVQAGASRCGASLVARPGLRRFHRAGCPMVAGKETEAMGRGDHEAAGRQPCGVCLP